MKKVLLLLTVFCMVAVSMSAQKKIQTKYRNALVLAYSQANSVFEDENIKLEIYDEQLWATNKTKKTIFIDVSQCFLFNNETAIPLRDTGESDKKSKKENKKASKMGVTSDDDLYISIAPSMGLNQKETFVCAMSTNFFGKYTTTETPSGDFTEHSKRFFTTIAELIAESHLEDSDDDEYEGTAYRHFTEDESINVVGASIAYAFNKKAEEWTNVALSTWVSDVIFAPFYVEMPQDLKNKDKKGFDVKETMPAVIHIKANSPFEFDIDKSPIILCDWVGNYKKGEFTLSETWISKKKGPSALEVIARGLLNGAAGLVAAGMSYRDVAYKRAIEFDGMDIDWGKMKYADKITDTEQTK